MKKALQAHIHILANCLNFRGRAPRSEFWMFLPLGAIIPLVTLFIALRSDLPVLAALALFYLFGLPLAAVGARRLQDTGEHGLDAVLPWFTFGLSIICFHWAFKVSAYINDAFSKPTPPDGPAGFGFVLTYGMVWLLMSLCAVGFLIVFVMRITPAFGQTLVASDPLTNKFGPNPNEVPS